MYSALLVVRDLSFVYNGLLITEPKILPAAGGKKNPDSSSNGNKVILVWNNSCLLKNNMLKCRGLMCKHSLQFNQSTIYGPSGSPCEPWLSTSWVHPGEHAAFMFEELMTNRSDNHSCSGKLFVCSNEMQYPSFLHSGFEHKGWTLEENWVKARRRRIFFLFYHY